MNVSLTQALGYYTKKCTSYIITLCTKNDIKSNKSNNTRRGKTFGVEESRQGWKGEFLISSSATKL